MGTDRTVQVRQRRASLIGWRIVARMVDDAVVLACQFPLVVAAALFSSLSTVAEPGREDDADRLAVTLLVTAWVIGVAYEVVSTRIGGGIGTRLCGLRVVSGTGRAPAWRRSVLRWLLVSSTLPLVWLWLMRGASGLWDTVAIAGVALCVVVRLVLFVSLVVSGGSDGVHDRLAGTRVISEFRPDGAARV